MTPAIILLKKHAICYDILTYEHEANTMDFGNEAVQKLGLTVNEVFKTLVVDIGQKDLVVCVISVGKKLCLKKVAEAFGVKKADMADKSCAQKQTGYLLGGISPLGQKKITKTVIDSDAQKLEFIYVSGGKRGLDIKIRPTDLSMLLNAQFYEIGNEKIL